MEDFLILFYLGHLHVIQSSLEHLQLQKLIVVPTFHNPLKEISTP